MSFIVRDEFLNHFDILEQDIYKIVFMFKPKSID